MATIPLRDRALDNESPGGCIHQDHGPTTYWDIPPLKIRGPSSENLAASFAVTAPGSILPGFHGNLENATSLEINANHLELFEFEQLCDSLVNGHRFLGSVSIEAS